MRVLLVTSSAPWAVRDGASLILDEQLRRLAGEHEITVLAPGARAPETPVPDETLPYPVAARWFGTTMPRGADYLLRKAWAVAGSEPAHVRWVERRTLLDAMRDQIARRPPAVVHLHGWGTAQFWRVAPHIPALHFAIDAWSLGVRNRLLSRWRTIVDRALEPDLARSVMRHERRHLARCAAVVVVSEMDAQYLRRTIPGARVEVVPLGVDAGPVPSAPPTEPVLGFHGVFQTAANRDAALTLLREVYPRVRASRPDARLFVIGRNPGPELRAFEDNGVVITGEVDDVRSWLERVAVYVAPMVSGTGMKNKVLEAMAAGRPIVATPLALEGVGPGDGVLVGTDASELADHIVALLSSPERIARMGRDARRRVTEGFSWDRSAAAVDRLWRELAT